jgi:hypothetical protein
MFLFILLIYFCLFLSLCLTLSFFPLLNITGIPIDTTLPTSSLVAPSSLPTFGLQLQSSKFKFKSAVPLSLVYLRDNLQLNKSTSAARAPPHLQESKHQTTDPHHPCPLPLHTLLFLLCQSTNSIN